MNTKKTNIETRISNRARSIFAALGTIVNDFYLEAGIYFVGGFNASLVAWDIYTDLLAGNQPLSYAIAVAIVAFIAVEGLAVYLVGAAAKTSNGLLWFFSVIFACFFTYAHYRQMTSQGNISEYITLAIPFFVVVGYWARTVKMDIEAGNNQAVQVTKDEAAHQRQIENETTQAAEIEAERNRQLADDDLAHKREMERLILANQQAVKLARVEVKKGSRTVNKSVKETVKTFTLDDLKDALQADGQPNLTQLAKDLHISRPTLYKRIDSLIDSGQVIKNGNGYEVNS